SVARDRSGNLVLHTSGGDVVEHAPVVYQENNRRHQAVAGRYVLEAHHQVGFQVGRYDHSKPLIIDPTLSYSSGSDQENQFGLYARRGGIALDAAGNAYVTGFTFSTNFPTKDAYQA